MNTCPHCNSSFDWNDPLSGHQVNDNFELIFCSYECSVTYTAHYIKNNQSTLSKENIAEMLDLM